MLKSIYFSVRSSGTIELFGTASVRINTTIYFRVLTINIYQDIANNSRSGIAQSV
jgi:hypothetical protein